jgi:type I restriction enzyme S subunit
MSSSDQVRTYSRAESVVFLKTDEPFGGLSNMAGGYPIRVNGIRILTSEALYQACRFPHLPDVQRMIIGENSPMTAKMRSKPYRKDSRRDWDQVRVRIMRWCLRMKLASNWSAFSELLLRTGDRPIVEQSRKDDFWGAKAVGDGSTLVGMNVLGRLLMELREQVKEHGRDAFLRVETPGIPDFQLLGRPIEVWALKAAEQGAAVLAMPQAGLFGDDLPSDQAVATDTASAILAADIDEQRSKSVALPVETESESDTQARRAGVRDQVTAYPGYRESGLPWVPKIPDGWQVLRNGRLFSHRVETGFPDLPILEVSLRTGVRVRDMENLKRKQVMSQKEKYKRAAKGDIAYNMMRMWQGAVGSVPVDGLVSPAYVVVKPYDEANSHYYSYLFRTAAYMQEVNKYSRGIVADRNRLYWESFKQMPSLVPPRPEQDQILAYLRAQDAHIARFIKAKRELIKLLTEQKRRIIDQAVTRGLDPNVRLKPSGIEWLGEVPEHWEVLPLRRIIRVKSGDMIHASEETEEGFPIYGGNGPRGFTKKVNCHGPMLLIGRVGAKCGCIHRVEGSFWASEHALRVIPLREFDLEFFEHLLRWIDFNRFAIRTAQPLINSTIVREQICAVPPVSEQVAICRWIADECRPLDDAIARAEEEIKLIREYRDRLIADVVTGQIDVRGWRPGPDDVVRDEELAALGDDEANLSEDKPGDGGE